MKRATREAMAADLKRFCADLLIDCDGEVKRFGDVMADFQREAIDNIAPSWMTMAKRSKLEPQYRRAFLEFGRGHAKTTLLAIFALWALFSSPMMIMGIAAAADKDQAKLLRNAIRRLVELNPWLKAYIDVQSWRVTNTLTGSELEIISSDVASSFGHLVDFIIADEVVCWSGRALWDSLISTMAKRKNCCFVAITNAGVGRETSEAWNIREACRNSDEWNFHTLDGPQAPWIDEKRLDEQRALLPAKAFERLWMNRWQTEAGDCLDLEDIRRCTVLTEPMPFIYGDEYRWMASLDIGLRHDRSAFIVLCIDIIRQKIIVCSVESWSPPRGGKVDLDKVLKAVVDAGRLWGVTNVIYDPWQADYLATKIQEADPTLHMVPYHPTAANLDAAANAVLQAFKNDIIELYPCRQLERDLAALSIVAKADGKCKLVADRSREGHADTAFALACGLARGIPFMRDMRFSYANEIQDQLISIAVP